MCHFIFVENLAIKKKFNKLCDKSKVKIRVNKDMISLLKLISFVFSFYFDGYKFVKFLL